MQRGAWHQFGDRSQELALEQLRVGAGVGVVISPRDISFKNATQRAPQYRELGSEVLYDPQYYVPHFSNKKLDSYPASDYRITASQLHRLTELELFELAQGIEATNRALSTQAVVAPAVVYEAGRPDIVELNARLFAVSKQVGDTIGVPTYGTVVLGRSAAATDATVSTALSHATALDADGWYFVFEFDPERLPSSADAVLRCCSAGLTLACTGKPVLHAYAGPMGLLSFGFGATGAAVGHSQNLWHFTRGRWGPADGQGGGGEAPARFFSSTLWGTIVHPDETAQLSQGLRDRVLTHSAFDAPWKRWQANKHLVNTLCNALANVAAMGTAVACADAAIGVLRGAVSLHSQITAVGVTLRDETNVYQANWQMAMTNLLNNRRSDFDYLELLQ